MKTWTAQLIILFVTHSVVSFTRSFYCSKIQNIKVCFSYHFVFEFISYFKISVIEHQCLNVHS